MNQGKFLDKSGSHEDVLVCLCMLNTLFVKIDSNTYIFLRTPKFFYSLPNISKIKHVWYCLSLCIFVCVECMSYSHDYELGVPKRYEMKLYLSMLCL